MEESFQINIKRKNKNLFRYYPIDACGFLSVHETPM